MSGGYYNSDEESDSSSVTNISYRENPVKVFKKKPGARKSGPRTSIRANSNASSDPPMTPGQSDVPSPPASSQTQPVVRTVPYVPTVATPRPALAPSSARSETPTCTHPVPPEKRPYSGLCSFNTPGLHLRPNHKELSQSGVDSSGYSSSEGTYRKPTVTPSSTSRSANSGAPSSGYRSRISSALFTLMGWVSLMVAAAQAKLFHVTALAKAPWSGRMKKACLLVLLLLILLLCLWFLLPVFASFISRMTVTKTLSQTRSESAPVIPVSPAPQPNTMHPAPAVNSAVVSTVVEAKMQHLLAELQLKQEQLLSQMKNRIQLDMHDLKAKLEVVESDSRLHLEQKVTGLGRQLVDYQTDSRNSAASLSLRIQALETQNARLSQELSSIQQMQPPAPCPDTSTTLVHNHLTPELEQAMEKWLTDRIKERDAVMLVDKGSCADCGHPMADRMPDFALETQGASVISTRCSETFRIRSACVTLFGFPIWYPSESPRTVIQGYPVLLPGRCWAFHGVEGTLVISLSHPIRITHVTLDHLPRYNSPTGYIDSAPKDFEVYGLKHDTDEGTLLGSFTYDENGASTQTFKLLNPSDEVYRLVELHVLTNWGHVEYTCLYRFRVHGKIAST